MEKTGPTPRKHPLGKTIAALPDEALLVFVRNALHEDLGEAGDVTSKSTIDEKSISRAQLRARETGVLCGLSLARLAFQTIDPMLVFSIIKKDGDVLQKGDVIAEIGGSTRSILAAERVALNFLTHLSGIASLTHKFVYAITGTKAVIACTRKTIPGLRHLEKYAVACGGGANHRFGLYDGILIKDNHVAAAGSVGEAVRRAKANAPSMIVEVEVDRMDQIAEALEAKADIIMLDNFSIDDMRKAVALINGRAAVEASGGIRLENAGAIAATGVDIISVGALTHSAPALDIGLDF